MSDESHYRILDIPAGASVEEIKRAYRDKAKDLHPDRNKSPHAHEEFIRLAEAYEDAIAAKAQNYKRYTSPFENAERKRQQEREQAIRRAQEYARMRYEEFEKTDAFQTINALNIILNHFIFLFVCCLLLSLPLVTGYFYPVEGTVLGIVFMLLVAWPVYGFIKHLFNLKQLWQALNSLVETVAFRIFIVSVVNIYLFIKVDINTMIGLHYMLFIFALSMCLFYYYILKKKNYYFRLFASVCLVPLFINGLFFINYYFSRNPRIEQYEFWNEHTNSRGYDAKTTVIHLENGAYEAYRGIRMFASLSEMKYARYIVYQFEDGLFGIRVMKEYRFIQ